MAHLCVSSFVPDVALPSTPLGNPVELRESGGKTTVLLAVHSARCPGCRDYLQTIAPLRGEFEVWDARLLVIVPEPLSEARNLTPPFGKVLSDADCSLADPATARLLLADRYGQIFESVSSGTSHELAAPRDLAEWLKYIGTLCPE